MAVFKLEEEKKERERKKKVVVVRKLAVVSWSYVMAQTTELDS